MVELISRDIILNGVQERSEDKLISRGFRLLNWVRSEGELIS
jgi:hypothetical protein